VVVLLLVLVVLLVRGRLRLLEGVPLQDHHQYGGRENEADQAAGLADPTLFLLGAD